MHGNDIKVEETSYSISGNSDNNLVDPFTGTQTDSSSFLTASIGEPRVKKQSLIDPVLKIP